MNVFNDEVIYPLAEWLAGDPNMVDHQNLTHAAVIWALVFAFISLFLARTAQGMRQGLSPQINADRTLNEIEARSEDEAEEDISLSRDELRVLIEKADPAYRGADSPANPLRPIVQIISIVCAAAAVLSAYWAYIYYTQA